MYSLPARSSDAGPASRFAGDRLANDGDPRCGDCGALCETPVYLPAWRFAACPACAAECAAADAAELAADGCECRFSGDLVALSR